MRETPNAQRAFLDYYALGPERSLPKLEAEYRRRSGGGQQVPTKRRRTLEGWSAEHNWQERIIAHIQEDADEVRKQLQERATKFGKRVATAIELDVTRLLQDLAKTKGAMLAQSTADVERLVKLFYQVARQPLSDRTEHTGLAGGPIEVEHGASALEELNSRLSGLVARIGEAGTSPDAD